MEKEIKWTLLSLSKWPKDVFFCLFVFYEFNEFVYESLVPDHCSSANPSGPAHSVVFQHIRSIILSIYNSDYGFEIHPFTLMTTDGLVHSYYKSWSLRRKTQCIKSWGAHYLWLCWRLDDILWPLIAEDQWVHMLRIENNNNKENDNYMCVYKVHWGG